jgi:hypothetical protein
MFFFEKKNQKTFALLVPWPISYGSRQPGVLGNGPQWRLAFA